MKIERYLDVEFESSCYKTPQFISFAKEYKKEIKKRLPEGYEMVSWTVGHFYVSAFVRKGDSYVYISCSDVRYDKTGWYGNILIRTAKNEKDYTGGANCYTSIPNITRAIQNIGG